MMPAEKQLTPLEFNQYIHQSISRRITEVIVHHTWRPRAVEYRGIDTVAGIRRYHMQVRGWSDNGYHFIVGPPGDIFRCRPLERSGGHCLNHNARSVGICHIGDFDVEEPTAYAGYQVGINAVAALCKRFNLSENDVYFHRDFADKSCPGRKFDRTQYRLAVKKAMNSDSLKVVLLPSSEVIDCNPAIENGTARVDLRAVAEALGYEVHDHIRDQVKIYLRPIDPHQ